MATDSVPAGGDPHRLLAHSRHLAHRVRLAQRVTWFPLLVLAAVHVLSIGDRVGNVRLGDDANRLIAMGVQDHQAVAPGCFIRSAAAAT